jgi:hypothetical protein
MSYQPTVIEQADMDEYLAEAWVDPAEQEDMWTQDTGLSSSSTTVSPQGMRFAEHVIKPMVPSMSKEVSVSFYLITLLHLCNDHNLVLSREDLRDFEVLSLEERGPVKGL